MKAKIILLVFSFTLLFTGVYAHTGGMGGTYTIDPSKSASATNFTSISIAVDSLYMDSMTSDVIIDIADGTYKDSIIM